MGMGINVITPNKKMGSGPLARYQALKKIQRQSYIHCFYEVLPPHPPLNIASMSASLSPCIDPAVVHVRHNYLIWRAVEVGYMYEKRL